MSQVDLNVKSLEFITKLYEFFGSTKVETILSSHLCVVAWGRYHSPPIQKPSQSLFSFDSSAPGAVLEISQKKLGTNLVIEGSQFKKKEVCVTPDATSVKIKNLFLSFIVRQHTPPHLSVGNFSTIKYQGIKLGPGIPRDIKNVDVN